MPEITTLSAATASPRPEREQPGPHGVRDASSPGIITGDNKEPVLISLEPRAIIRALLSRRRGFFANPGRPSGWTGSSTAPCRATCKYTSGTDAPAACRLYAARQSCAGHGDRAGRLHHPEMSPASAAAVF